MRVCVNVRIFCGLRQRIVTSNGYFYSVCISVYINIELNYQINWSLSCSFSVCVCARFFYGPEQTNKKHGWIWNDFARNLKQRTKREWVTTKNVCFFLFLLLMQPHKCLRFVKCLGVSVSLFMLVFVTMWSHTQTHGVSIHVYTCKTNTMCIDTFANLIIPLDETCNKIVFLSH